MAYIVREHRIAFFLHEDDTNPVMEPGLQVPAGTCEPGEPPERAVIREASEETGLVGLRVVRYLGEADYDMRPYRESIHHRHFFQLEVVGPVDNEWRHVERDRGSGPPRPFLFSWLPIAQAHVLVAGLGAMLSRIDDSPP